MKVEEHSTFRHQGSREAFDDRDTAYRLDGGVTVCVVLDGHMGCDAADFVSGYIRRYLTRNLSRVNNANVPKLIENVFRKCQLSMLLHSDYRKFVRTGTTVALLVARGDTAWVANVGDTRCWIVRQEDGGRRVDELTTAHNLSNWQEKLRVLNTKSWYDRDYVFGRINVTRALGNLWQIRELALMNKTYRMVYPEVLRKHAADIPLVQQIFEDNGLSFSIHYAPSVATVKLTPGDSFVMATDGLDALVEEAPDLIHGVAVLPPDAMKSALHGAVSDRRRRHLPMDNVTVRVLHVSE